MTVSKFRKKLTDVLQEHALTIAFVWSALFGIVLGLILASLKDDHGSNVWTSRELLALKSIGHAAGSLTRIIVVPLVLTSAVTVTGSTQVSLSLHLMLRSGLTLAGLGFMVLIAGSLLAVALQPGIDRRPLTPTTFTAEKGLLVDGIMDSFRNWFPDNIVSATFQIAKTNLEDVEDELDAPLRGFKRGVNIGGMASFGFAAGMACRRLDAFGRPVLTLCHSIVHVTTIMSRWVVWVLPLLVATDFATIVIENYTLEGQAKAQGAQGILQAFDLYIVIMVIITVTYSFLIMPAMYLIGTKEIPLRRFMLNITPAILIAFFTSSSTLAFPTLIYCIERSHVNARVSRLVVLLAYSITLAGTSLQPVVATIYAAQKEKQEINFQRLLLTTLSYLSASNNVLSGYWNDVSVDPSLLRVFNLSGGSLAYISHIDWLADRITTVMNTVGVSVIAAMLQHQYQKKIAKLPAYNEVLREGLLLKRLTSLAAETADRVEEPLVAPDNARDSVVSHIRHHSVMPRLIPENEPYSEDFSMTHKSFVPPAADTGTDRASKKSTGTSKSALQHLKKVGKVVKYKSPRIKLKQRKVVSKAKKAKKSDGSKGSKKQVTLDVTNDDENLTEIHLT